MRRGCICDIGWGEPFPASRHDRGHEEGEKSERTARRERLTPPCASRANTKGTTKCVLANNSDAPVHRGRKKILLSMAGRVWQSEGKKRRRALSSVGQSGRLIISWSQVQVLQGPCRFFRTNIGAIWFCGVLPVHRGKRGKHPNGIEKGGIEWISKLCGHIAVAGKGPTAGRPAHALQASGIAENGPPGGRALPNRGYTILQTALVDSIP